MHPLKLADSVLTSRQPHDCWSLRLDGDEQGATAELLGDRRVVAGDRFNAASDDVVLAAVTSQVRARLSSFELLLEPGDLADGALPKRSVVLIGKLVTTDQSLILRRVGRLSEAKLGEVLEALRAFLQRT